MEILEIFTDENGTEIEVEFKKNEQEATFSYDLVDDEIIDCNYIEVGNEDIYEEIHNWIRQNITFKTKIIYNNGKTTKVLY